MRGTHLQQGVVVGSILLSASTYLFDFATNLLVLQQYSARYIYALKRGRSTACDATCRLQNSYLAGYFYALLAILLFSHSLNALLFKLRFTQHHAPLCAAYFLPLIHLYDLCTLLWRTLSCKGVQDLRSTEMNGLYCILGSALEGIPMLNLQFAAYLILTRHGVFVHGMPTTFKVSVVASLISATYSGGASVQSVAKNAMNLKENVIVGLIAGGFTLSAAVLRSVTFINILVYINQYFSQHSTDPDQGEFNVSDLTFVLVSVCTIAAYCLYYWLLHFPTNFFRSLRDAHRLFMSLAFSYMSLMMGPLYPMVSLASDTNQLGQCIFRRKLCLLALLNLFLDLTFLSVAVTMGTLPKPYFIVCLIAATFYLVFLCAYMKFDAFCGPIKSSQYAGPVQSAQPTLRAKHTEPQWVRPGQRTHAEAPFIEVIAGCEQSVDVSCPLQRRAAAPDEVLVPSETPTETNSVGLNPHADLPETGAQQIKE